MVGRAWTWFGALSFTVGMCGTLSLTPAAADPVRPSASTTTATPTTPTTTMPVATDGTGAAPALGTGGRWVTISGRGFGHGVGMAQDGAYWMGRQGRSSTEILRHFYPGTSLGSRGGSVRVPLGGAGVVTLTLADGGSVSGRRIAPGESVTIRADGGALVATLSAGTPTSGDDAPPDTSPGPSLAMTPIAFRVQTPSAPVEPAPTTAPLPAAAPAVDPPAPTTTTTAVAPIDASPAATTPAAPLPSSSADPATDPTPPTPPPSTAVVATESAAEPVTTTTVEASAAVERNDSIRGSPLVVTAAPGGTVTYGGRRYRGAFELRAQGGVRVVNELDVEQYLRGMGEVTDPRWPAAALEAQAIAARTYAFRTMASAGEVCPTQRCQVYVGVKAEYGAMDKAVAATRGKVVTYAKGKLAVTFYSASGGGTIATPAEAFGGSGDFPYLQAGTYPTGDLKSWVVTMSIDEVGRRVGYRGTATRVAVTTVGPSGRAVDVTVFGSGAPLVVPGPRFDAALGLRSTLFTLSQSDTRESAGVLEDAEVLTDSAAADQSRASSDPIVFSQTGFFEQPSTDEAAATPNSSPQPPERSSPTVEPAARATTGSTSSATPTPSDNEVALGKPAALPAEPSHATEVVFLGALTITGTTVLAAARRWLRSRRSTH